MDIRPKAPVPDARKPDNRKIPVMAMTPDAIQAALEKLDRDLRTRDQGLVRAFDILCTEIKRLQSMVGELSAATMDTLERQRELMESLSPNTWPDDDDPEESPAIRPEG